MVRDDFWMAVTRFLSEMEVELVQGKNFVAADLFDLRHARKVLSAFGQAFGTLPEIPKEITPDQQEFLKQAVSGLAQEGKVICVRLALSPMGEADRHGNEVPHQQRIGRTFAIASKIVTKAQFRHFQQANPDVGKPDIEQYSRTDDSPRLLVDLYDAARYCNWLSKNEGIPKEQWCYEPNDQGKYAEGMKPSADYLKRSGYRLPTEAEWEYACRSGSQTSRYYGLSVKVLPKYAWFLDDSDHRAWPVGMKKPNDFGLFDMHGNAWQWCDNSYADYAVGSDGFANDPGSLSVAGDKDGRVLRGGGFANPALFVRSAFRGPIHVVPTNRYVNGGFRPARTFP